jgi:hypothetical protein
VRQSSIADSALAAWKGELQQVCSDHFGVVPHSCGDRVAPAGPVELDVLQQRVGCDNLGAVTVATTAALGT